MSAPANAGDCTPLCSPQNIVRTPDFEVRVENIVDGYADAAHAFADELGPSYSAHLPALIAAYLHAAALVHAAELAPGIGRELSRISR